MRAVLEDGELRAKVGDASTADEVARVAAEAGFDVRADDLAEGPTTISDADLEAVVGGTVVPTNLMSVLVCPQQPDPTALVDMIANSIVPRWPGT